MKPNKKEKPVKPVKPQVVEVIDEQQDLLHEPLEQRDHRDDKIFNNSYHHGDKLKGDDYEMGSSLAVDSGYASRYLGDIYDYENNINYKIVQTEIIKLIDSDYTLNSIINDPKKKKFNRAIINKIFGIIYNHLISNKETANFVDPINVFDCISNISGLKYQNLFDLLDFEYKQILLVELDKKYNILKTPANPNSNNISNMF